MCLRRFLLDSVFMLTSHSLGDRPKMPQNISFICLLLSVSINSQIYSISLMLRFSLEAYLLRSRKLHVESFIQARTRRRGRGRRRRRWVMGFSFNYVICNDPCASLCRLPEKPSPSMWMPNAHTRIKHQTIKSNRFRFSRPQTKKKREKRSWTSLKPSTIYVSWKRGAQKKRNRTNEFDGCYENWYANNNRNCQHFDKDIYIPLLCAHL